MEDTSHTALIYAARRERELAERNAVNRILKFARDIGIGAGAAIIAKTIVAPAERVKLLLQVCSHLINYFSSIRLLQSF